MNLFTAVYVDLVRNSFGQFLNGLACLACMHCRQLAKETEVVLFFMMAPSFEAREANRY